MARRPFACGGGCPRCDVGASTVRQALRGEARPVDGADRQRLEPRLGGHSGDVRLHVGSTAAAAARSLGARAFTLGPDIVVGAGEYRPRDPQLATPGDRFEAETERVAGIAVGGLPPRPVRERPAAQRLQLAPAPGATPAGDPTFTMPDGSVIDGASIEALLLATPAIAGLVGARIKSGGSIATATTFLDFGDCERRFVAYALGSGGTPRNDPRTGAPFDPVSAHEYATIVHGFVDQSTHELFVRKHGGQGTKTMLQTSIHEALHFYTGPRVSAYWGFDANEGLTDFFTVEVCRVHRLDTRSLAYDTQRSAVEPIFTGGYLTMAEMAERVFGRDYLIFERRFPAAASAWGATMRASNPSLAKSELRRNPP